MDNVFLMDVMDFHPLNSSTDYKGINNIIIIKYDFNVQFWLFPVNSGPIIVMYLHFCLGHFVLVGTRL